MIQQIPSLFIGSSTEGLDIAREVELQLEKEVDVTIWKDGIFLLGEGTLESLINALDEFDFGIMVLTPDDVIESRGQNYASPRDNVLFELGLFMGRLGRKRCFILHEEGDALKLPSDLAGISRATFRHRNNFSSSVSPACTRIIKAIRSLGVLEARMPTFNNYSSYDEGLLSLFSPNSNQKRNSNKEKAILEAEKYVQLTAITGHSYLAAVGSKFQGALLRKLDTGIPATFYLSNPWSLVGLSVAVGENHDHLEQYKRALQSIGTEEAREIFDPIKVIEKSSYFQHKLPVSIDGYKHLKEKYGNLISLKIVHGEMTATVLITEKIGYIEPYINSALRERMAKHMHTFEIEFSGNSYLADTMKQHLTNLEVISMHYDDFLLKEDYFKNSLSSKFIGKVCP